MKNIVAMSILWLALIVQSTVFQIPPIRVLQPNLVLVVLMMVALTRGPRATLVLGVLVGLIQDINFGSFLGLNAFTYGVIGYFAATAFAQFLHRNLAITFLVTVALTFVEQWITFGLNRMFGVALFSGYAALSNSFSVMIQNGIALLLLYPILVRVLASRERSRYERETET